MEHEYWELVLSMVDCYVVKLKTHQNWTRRRNIPSSMVSRPLLAKGPYFPFHELDQNWHKTVTRPGKNETLSTLQKPKSWFSAVMLWGNPKEKISYNHQSSPPKTGELRSCCRFGDSFLPPHANMRWRDLEHRSLQIAEAVRNSAVQKKSKSPMINGGKRFRN